MNHVKTALIFVGMSVGGFVTAYLAIHFLNVAWPTGPVKTWIPI